MDSTIITSETLDDFAKLVGKGKEIKKKGDNENKEQMTVCIKLLLE